MDPIDAAIEAMNSLCLGERPNITKYARDYDVDRTTLSRRWRGIQGPQEGKNQSQQYLSIAQELVLVKKIERLTKQGLEPTDSMLRAMAGEIRGDETEPGIHWPKRFRNRYADRLVYQWSSGMDGRRHRADNAINYSYYFAYLGSKLEQYGIKLELTYNMDEKGFLLGVLLKSKRTFGKARYERTGLKKHLSDGNR